MHPAIWIILLVVCLGLGFGGGYLIFTNIAKKDADGALNKARKIIEDANKEAEEVVEEAKSKAKKQFLKRKKKAKIELSN